MLRQLKGKDRVPDLHPHQGTLPHPHFLVLLVHQRPKFRHPVIDLYLVPLIHLKEPVQPRHRVVLRNYHIVAVQPTDVHVLFIGHFHINDVFLVLICDTQIPKPNERVIVFQEGQQVVLNSVDQNIVGVGLLANLAVEFLEVEHLAFLAAILELGQLHLQPLLQTVDVLILAGTFAVA